MSASFYAPFTLNQSQSQSVAEALASIAASEVRIQAIADQIGRIGGDLSAADIAAILAARDEAVSAAALIEGAAAETQENVDAAIAARTSIEAIQSAILDIQAAVELARAATESARDDAQEARGSAEVSASAAGVSAASANSSRLDAIAAAIKAGRYANDPPGTEVEPGAFSTKHYLELNRAAARQAAALPVQRMATQPGGNNRTLVAADLFKLHLLKNTTGMTFTLPPGIWTTPAADGSESIAWFQYAKDTGASGGVTLQAAGSAAVIYPTILLETVFPASIAAPVTGASYAHSVSVPAGTNRKIQFSLIALHNSSKTGRSSAITASNTSSLTKIREDTVTGNYNSAPGAGSVPVTVWKAVLADSATPTTVAISLTPDESPLAYVLHVIAAGNTASIDTVVKVTNLSTAGPTTTIPAITTTIDKQLTVFGYAFQGAGRAPLVHAGGGAL